MFKKKSLLFLFLIIVITLGVNFWQTSNKLRVLGDINMHYFLFHYNKESILEHKQFPLWFDNMFSGFPFFANSQADTLFFYAWPFMFLLPTKTALNMTMLIGVFLAAIFMYILMLNMKLKPKFAFISAIVWAFSTINLMYIDSWIARYKVLVFIPLTFLFFMKAFEKNKWFMYSVLAGVSLGLQFHGGGVDFFLFSSVIFGAYLLFMLFGKNFKVRLVKVVLISVVAGLVMFGLIAVKLMPAQEFQKVSSKQQGFSFEESIGGKVDFSNVFDIFFYQIGIITLILALFGLSYFKKKKVLFSIILVIVGILVVTGSFLYFILWKFVPGVNATHYVSRNMFIVVFGLAILAGYGTQFLFNKFKRRNVVYILIAILVIAQVGFLIYRERSIHIGKYATYYGPDFTEMIEQNELLQYLSKQPGLFRIENIGSSGHSGMTMVYVTPLDLERLYGHTSVWIPEYFNVYLGVAHQSQAKFWGMLNAKYVYYKDSVNITGFRFIRKFNECEICIEDPLQDPGVDGPYLYENELYLPRAYIADYSVLVIGGKEQVDQTTYALMLNENFDPSDLVLVMQYGKVNDYGINFLKRFDAVFLTQGSIDENSGGILSNYVDQGGILLPNLVEEKNTITEEDVNNLLKLFWGDYSNVEEVDFDFYSPNKRVIKLDGKKGWLVLAEKFFMFEGWEPRIDGKKKLNYRANGINTAVWLDGETGDLIFDYSPSSFKKGLAITLITLFLVILYFGFLFFREVAKRKKKKNRGKINNKN